MTMYPPKINKFNNVTVLKYILIQLFKLLSLIHMLQSIEPTLMILEVYDT